MKTKIILLATAMLLMLTATGAELYLSTSPSSATRQRLIQSGRTTSHSTDGHRHQFSESHGREIFRSSSGTSDETASPGTRYTTQLPGTFYCTFCYGYTMPGSDGKCSVCGSAYDRGGVGEQVPLDDGAWLTVSISMLYLAGAWTIQQRRRLHEKRISKQSRQTTQSGATDRYPLHNRRAGNAEIYLAERLGAADHHPVVAEEQSAHRGNESNQC